VQGLLAINSFVLSVEEKRRSYAPRASSEIANHFYFFSANAT